MKEVPSHLEQTSDGGTDSVNETLLFPSESFPEGGLNSQDYQDLVAFLNQEGDPTVDSESPLADIDSDSLPKTWLALLQRAKRVCSGAYLESLVEACGQEGMPLETDHLLDPINPTIIGQIRLRWASRMTQKQNISRPQQDYVAQALERRFTSVMEGERGIPLEIPGFNGLVLKYLGRGGMGSAYQVYHPEHGVCVLKVSHDGRNGNHGNYNRQQLKAEFQNMEYTLGACLEHGHQVFIPRPLEQGALEDRQEYLLMSYEPRAATVDDLMTQQEGLSPGTAVHVASELAEHLSVVNRHRIYNQDAKPANVMVNDRGEVIVLDLGLARRVYADIAEAVGLVDDEETHHDLPDDTPGASNTSPSITANISRIMHEKGGAGTMAYMSKAQMQGEAVDDAYGTVATLLHMLTGKDLRHYCKKGVEEGVENVKVLYFTMGLCNQGPEVFFDWEVIAHDLAVALEISPNEIKETRLFHLIYKYITTDPTPPIGELASELKSLKKEYRFKRSEISQSPAFSEEDYLLRKIDWRRPAAIAAAIAAGVFTLVVVAQAMSRPENGLTSKERKDAERAAITAAEEKVAEARAAAETEARREAEHQAELVAAYPPNTQVAYEKVVVEGGGGYDIPQTVEFHYETENEGSEIYTLKTIGGGYINAEADSDVFRIVNCLFPGEGFDPFAYKAFLQKLGVNAQFPQEDSQDDRKTRRTKLLGYLVKYCRPHIVTDGEGHDFLVIMNEVIPITPAHGDLSGSAKHSIDYTGRHRNYPGFAAAVSEKLSPSFPVTQFDGVKDGRFEVAPNSTYLVDVFQKVTPPEHLSTEQTVIDALTHYLAQHKSEQGTLVARQAQDALRDRQKQREASDSLKEGPLGDILNLDGDRDKPKKPFRFEIPKSGRQSDR